MKALWTGIRIWLFIIAPFTLLAQNTAVQGTVKDATSGEKMPGVIVLIDNAAGAVTDADGKFNMEAKAGQHALEFRMVGYASLKQSIAAKGAPISLNIKLKSTTGELETVVVSASRFEQRIEETTVSMEVLKPALIQRNNTTNMETAIDQVPGVNVMDGNVSIRGGSGFSYGAGSRVLLLVDDLPMLTADAGDVKWSFLPTENIEQVEIIKGASSALFGSSALNGVINMRTAQPTSEPRSSVHFFSGVYDTPKRPELRWWKNANPIYSGTSFSDCRRIGQLDLVTGGNAFLDQGYRQGEQEQRVRVNINTNYHFKQIEGLSAGINASTSKSRGGNFLIWLNDSSGAYKPLGGIDTPSTTLSNYITTRTSIDPHVTYMAKNGSTQKLRGRFFRANNENDSKQQSIADLYYGEYSFSQKFKNNLSLSTGLGTMTSIVGSELYGDHRGTNYFAFVQMEKKFFNKLIVSGGLRGEYYSVDSTKTQEHVYLLTRLLKDSTTLIKNSAVKPVARLGLNYQVMKATFLRASYGEGYRFPTIAEKYVKTNAGAIYIYPNDSVKPETGWSSELGIRQGFKVSSFTGYVDISGFWTEYHDMMEFTFGTWDTSQTAPLGGLGFKSKNVSDAVIRGIDASIVGNGMIGPVEISIMAGYTYLEPLMKNFNPTVDTLMNSANYNVLKYRYRHVAKADLQLTYKKVSIGGSYRYNSRMENIDRVFEVVIPGVQSYRAAQPPGDGVFDARIAFLPKDKISVSFIAKNVANREYMGRPADLQAMRSFVLQGDFKF